MSPKFVAKLNVIGARIGKTEAEMRALWTRHVEANHDQSALLSEFINWNATAWGLTEAVASDLVDEVCSMP